MIRRPPRSTLSSSSSASDVYKRQKRIGIPVPSDGVWWIGYDCLKWLIIPMHWVSQRVSIANVELVIIDVMQEHINSAKIVGGNVDFLPIEPLPNVLLAENLGKVQQQRTGTTGWIIYFVDFRFPNKGNTRQKLAHLLRCVVLAATFTGIGGIHPH